MKELELLPCPFCGYEKIRILEEKTKKGCFKGYLYTFAWCRMCGTKGPWAWSVHDDLKVVVNECIDRWNERGGVKQ